MSIRSKITSWRNVSSFCAERITDYGELLPVEIDETRKRLVRELVALLVLAAAGLFTLSFMCVAIIATAWGTPYFLAVVWGVAGAWLFISLIALLVVRVQKPAQSLQILREEIRSDLDTLREALE